MPGLAHVYYTHFWLKEIETHWRWYENGVWNERLLASNEYTHDDVGNRLTNTISLRDEQNQLSVRTETYGYDTLYRLTSADYGDGQTQGYTFDPMGNRLTKSDNWNGNETYAYNNANMLTTRNLQSYTNDWNGNTLTGGGRTNTWDSQNRLVECAYNGNTNEFIYGADGLRRASIVNGTRTDFAYDGQSVVREMRDIDSDDILDPIVTYLPSPRGIEYRRNDQTGVLRWYVYDGLGSVLSEVEDNTGAVTGTRTYDVYGSVRAISGVNTSKHKFVGGLGHPSEDETGLIYMRARYMDPALISYSRTMAAETLQRFGPFEPTDSGLLARIIREAND